MPEIDPRDAALARHDEAARRRRDAQHSKDRAAQAQAAFDCGQALFDLGDLGLARRLFDESRREIEDSGQRQDLLPEALGMIGRTQQRARRWDDVLPWYRRAADVAAAQGLAAQQLRWLHKEAATLFDMKQPDTGLARMREALTLGRAMRDAGQAVQETLVDLLCRLADEEPNASDAEPLWAEAEELLASLPPGKQHVRAAINQGDWQARQRRFELADTYFEQAEALAADAAIGAADAGAAHGLRLRRARALRDMNEGVRSGELLIAALPTTPGARERLELLAMAVESFYVAHAWRRQLQACVAQCALLEQVGAGPADLANARLQLSVALRELGRHADALVELDRALALTQDLGDSELLTRVRGQRALVLLDLGCAVQSAELGAMLWAEGSRQSLMVGTQVRALIGCGRLDQAEQLLKDYEAAGNATDPVTLARGRAQLAQAGRGDARQAWYDLGLAAGSDRRVQAEALTALMRHTPRGSADRFEQARHRLRVMDVARTKVADVFSDESWHAAFAEADQFRGWLDDLVDEALAGGQGAAAIYELERFRAQTLVDLLADRAAWWRAGQPDVLLHKNLANQEAVRERYRLRAMVARHASWAERRAQARRADAAERRARITGPMHIAPGGLGLHFPQDLAGLLGDHRLSTGEAMVFAHALADKVALWLMGADGKVHVTVLDGIGRDDLCRHDRSLRKTGSAGEVDPPTPLAALMDELNERFVVPLAAMCREHGARHVYFCAGTEWAALPLDSCAALRANDAPGFSWLPSGAVLGFARQSRTPRTDLFDLIGDAADLAELHRTRVAGRTLVVTDPTRELALAPLETLLIECAHAGRELLRLGPGPVDKGALCAACGSVEVLHFAGHGQFDESSPYRSGLWIAPADRPDAVWTNADIFGDVLAHSGLLAVLSGCESGQTQPNLVNEEVSLPAAFLAAGFRAVVATRWSVHDLSATLLSTEFHRRWREGGIGVAAALAGARRWLADLTREQARALLRGVAQAAPRALGERAALARAACAQAEKMLDTLDGDRPFADPWHWAAFYVSGDGAVQAPSAMPVTPSPCAR